MTQERVQTLEHELEQLQAANDALYRQHANEKAQMQLAIEQEKLRCAELLQANDAYRDENEQWRAAYEQLEASKRQVDESYDAEKRAFEDRIALLEESVKQYSTELVGDLEDLENERATRQASEQLVVELQTQINESNERFSQLTTEYDSLHAAYESAQYDKSDAEQKRWDLETQFTTQVADLERENQRLATELEAAAQQKQQQLELERVRAAEAAERTSKSVDCQTTQCDATNEESTEQQSLGAEKDDTIAQLHQQIRRLEEEVSLLSLTCGGSAKPGAAAASSLRDLQQQIFAKSEAIVQQGEKHVALAEKFESVKRQWLELRSEVSGVRLLLLRGVAGSNVDESLYQHVRLDELVRLRLKALEHEWLLTGNASERSAAVADTTDAATNDVDRVDDASSNVDDDTESGATMTDKPAMSTHLANVSAFSALDGLGSIGRLERELRLCRSRNKRLQDQHDALVRELQTATQGLSDFQALKERSIELTSRERVEKELRLKTDANLKESNEKLVALSEHIEKLMVHLKHEAAAKTKAVDAQRRAERELSETRDRVAVLTKKHTSKDAQLQELEQGAKILEDQLRLMDEKFIDVRTKLDWTRATSQKETKRLHSELSALRMKWQMASDAGVLASLPDWASVAKLSKKTKAPLGTSTSDSRLPTTATGGGGSSNNNTSSIGSPPGYNGSTPSCDDTLSKRTRFEIPKLPQPDADIGTPWSDAKLLGLQRQFQDRRKV